MFSFIIIIVLLNVIYFINNIIEKKDYLIFKIVFLFFIPGVGLITLLILDYYTKKSGIYTGNDIQKMNNIDGAVSYSENIINKPYLRRDISKTSLKSISFISIEDALLFNTDDIKRKFVIETIKDDAFKYLHHLKKAINDPDSETSHYAATAINEIKRKMTISIQELSEKNKENNNDIVIASSYANILKNYVESGLLDEKNKQKYSKEISLLMGKLIELKPLKEYFIDKINFDLYLKDYEQAKKYCTEFMEYYKESEEAYLMMMKYYYMQHNFIGFNRILEQLKKSAAEFSVKSLNTVRFWDSKSLYGEIL